MAGEFPAVRVESLHKSFLIPVGRVARLRERVRHPLTRGSGRELQVLRGISFEVGRGEFFGVIGRNGSGKSTLLKLLASIYRADSGTIAVAGRLAPFIELGVGFNTELSAHDNVLLNGVMMGLTPREARDRFDRIMAFGDLDEFAEMKLKNYSSGMRVRLAFSIMVEADPDVFLIDEVLAVGDAEFQRKCSQEFYRLRERGKTIVLVTHSMPTVKEFCHRALLLEDGRIERIGEPEEVTRRYAELALEQRADGAGASLPSGDGAEPARTMARIAEAWIVDGEGNRSGSVHQGKPIEIHAVLDVTKRIERPAFRLELRNERGAVIFSPAAWNLGGPDYELLPGERRTVRATIENRVSPGSYTISCGLARRGRGGGEVAVSAASSLELEVVGPQRRGTGLVMLDYDVRLEEARPTAAASR